MVGSVVRAQQISSTRYVLACPIWCAMLPWLIARALWLRRRLRKNEPAGFAVVQSQ